MNQRALLYLNKPEKLTYFDEENAQKHTSAHLAGVQLNHMEGRKDGWMSAGKNGRWEESMMKEI